MSGRKRLVIVGAGEFAQIACEYFRHDSDYEVAAFSVERDFLTRSSLADVPVVAYEDLEQHYRPNEYAVFVAIPATQLNRLRMRFYEDVLRRGYRCASYVSSRAFVWRNAQIGANCFIFEGNVIQPFTRIGDNCILWSGNHVGHRTVVQDHVFIASHAVISGYCEIGRGSFIGVNATLSDKVQIAADNIIGSRRAGDAAHRSGRVYVIRRPRAVAGRSSFDVEL